MQQRTILIIVSIVGVAAIFLIAAINRQAPLEADTQQVSVFDGKSDFSEEKVEDKQPVANTENPWRKTLDALAERQEQLPVEPENKQEMEAKLARADELIEQIGLVVPGPSPNAGEAAEKRQRELESLQARLANIGKQ